MRRLLLSSLMIAAAALALAGCGGGSGDGDSDFVKVTTGRSGRLEDGVLGPSGGSTFISTATIFQLSWPGAPPPSEFNIGLRRYKEPRGGQPKEVSTQKISVNQQGSSFAWNIQRRDNFDLDRDGVYFLEANAPGSSTLRKAYIIASGRTKPGRDIDTGGNGSLAGLQIFPSPGEVNIPRNTTWRLTWSNNNQPPPRIDIRIIRYKEARGDQPRDVSEQRQNIQNRGNFVFDVNRRDNFLLDSEGVYFLEISAPGETAIRAAYIVDSN